MADLRQERAKLGELVIEQLRMKDDFEFTIKQLIKILDNKLVIPSVVNVPLTPEGCTRELTRLNISVAYFICNDRLYYVAKNMQPRLLVAQDHSKEADLRAFCVRVAQGKMPGHMSTLSEHDMQAIVLLTKGHRSLEDVVGFLQQTFEIAKTNREQVEKLLKEAEEQRKEIADHEAQIVARKQAMELDEANIQEVRVKIAETQAWRRAELQQVEDEQNIAQRELIADKAEVQSLTEQLKAEQDNYQKILQEVQSAVEQKRQELTVVQDQANKEIAEEARDVEEMTKLRQAIEQIQERPLQKQIIASQKKEASPGEGAQEWDNMSDISAHTLPARARLYRQPLTAFSLRRMVDRFQGRRTGELDLQSNVSTYTLPVAVQMERMRDAYVQHIERLRVARDGKKGIQLSFRMR